MSNNHGLYTPGQDEHLVQIHEELAKGIAEAEAIALEIESELEIHSEERTEE